MAHTTLNIRYIPVKIDNPCKDCEKRATGCHSTCLDYKEYKRKYNATKCEYERKKSEDKKRYNEIMKTWSDFK